MIAGRKVQNNHNDLVRKVKRLIYSCEEHIEIALDDIVDQYQTYPVLSQVPVDKSPTGCEYCEKQAVYMVENK